MSQRPVPAPFDPEEEKRQQRQRWRAVLLGVSLANLSGLLLVLLGQYLGQGTSLYITSDFTLVPFVMGVVGEFYWRTTEPRELQRFGLSILTATIALILAAIFLGEGVICLFMAAPLLILIVWFGALVGSWLFSKVDSRLGVSVLPLLLALMVCDARSPHTYAHAVTDTIRIKATPARVWRYCAGYPSIRRPPDYWLWRIGLPCPVQSTTEGEFVGAGRKCVFTRNVVFDERISVCRPAQELMFDITSQPNYPEIVHHLVLERGQFLLHDNGDGTG